MENTERRSPLMPFILGLIVGIAGFFIVSTLIDDDDDYSAPPIVVEPCEDWSPSSDPNKIAVSSIDPDNILSIEGTDGLEYQGGSFPKCVLNYLVEECTGDDISYRFANVEGKVGLYITDNFSGISPSEIAFFTAEDAFCPMRCE